MCALSKKVHLENSANARESADDKPEDCAVKDGLMVCEAIQGRTAFGTNGRACNRIRERCVCELGISCEACKALLE